MRPEPSTRVASERAYAMQMRAAGHVWADVARALGCSVGWARLTVDKGLRIEEERKRAATRHARRVEMGDGFRRAVLQARQAAGQARLAEWWAARETVRAARRKRSMPIALATFAERLGAVMEGEGDAS